MMSVRLPVEIRRDEFEGWLASFRALTELDLVVCPPGTEGSPLVANGETFASLSFIAAGGEGCGDAPEQHQGRIEEAARLLSRLAEDRITKRDLVTQTARLWKEQNFLTGVATALTVTSTPEETARKLLARIVKLLGVERASIVLAREDGRLVLAAAQGTGVASQVGSLVPLGGVADRVYQTGEPILVEDTERLSSEDHVAQALHREARSNSFLSVPILSNGVPVGVINVTDRLAGRPFQAEDKKLVTAISAQVGIAFANLKLLEDARRAEALKRELDLAARIQRSLLPKGPFQVDGFDVFGRCEPAAYVGGDSFEIAERPNGGLWAAIEDVSGHGISAALLMASARAALKALVSADLPPQEAAHALNALITADAGDTGMFLTAAFVRVDEDGKARLCSMGHPAALVLRRDGSVERFEKGGAPAGIIDDETYEEDVTTIAPGDVIVLYTDGVTEANAGSGQLGDEGLAAALTRAASSSAEEITGAVFTAVYDHLAGRAVNDDITVLVARRNAS